MENLAESLKMRIEKNLALIVPNMDDDKDYVLKLLERIKKDVQIYYIEKKVS